MNYIQYNPLKIVTIDSVQTTSIGRFYQKGANRFPSVSTILDFSESESSKQFLRRWRSNPENKIKNQISLKYGTAFHKETEAIVKGIKGYSNEHPFKDFFKNIKYTLASELSLICPQLKVGGTLDLLIEDFEGNVLLIDYKTSQGFKTRNGVQRYLDQAALYSIMAEEIYGVEIHHCEIWVLAYEVDIVFNPPEFQILGPQDFKLEKGYFDRRKTKVKKLVEDYHFWN